MITHIFKLIWNRKGKNALLIIEIFLAFLILFAVLSFVITKTDRLAQSKGFSTEDRWMIFLDGIYDKDSTEYAQIMTSLKSEFENLPEVVNVGFSNSVTPYGGSTWTTTSDDMGFEMTSRFARASENFANTMDINVIEGRWFQAEDEFDKYPPMIVNKYFMDTYFPGKSMIDSIIPFNGENRIIGVVDDYRYQGVFEEDQSTSFFFRPYTSKDIDVAYLTIGKNASTDLEEKISDIIIDVTKSKKSVIMQLENLERRADRRTWVPMIALISIGGFLCLNVALGLFGVLWYNISKRKPEIGLRKALGAHAGKIASQFTLEVLILTALGLILGVFFALQVPILKIVDLPASVFYRAIVFAFLIITAIVTLCALYPSLQASRIHAATALHED